MSIWLIKTNSPHGIGCLGGTLVILVSNMSGWWNQLSVGTSN